MIQCLSFCGCLISLNIMSARVICVVTNGKIFLCLNNIPLCVCVCVCVFARMHMHTHVQACARFSCPCFSFIFPGTLMFVHLGYCKWCWTEHGCVDIFWDTHFISFDYIPRSRIARSYGGFVFKILRSTHTVFCYGHSNLPSPLNLKLYWLFLCLNTNIPNSLNKILRGNISVWFSLH